MVIVAAGLLLMVSALAWWRARPNFGVKRGLPPGSLGIVSSIQALRDQDFYARAAERFGAVFKCSQFHRSVVCITDLPLALDVLEQHASSLREPWQPFGRRSPRQSVAFLTDKNDPRYRAILNRPLLSAAVRTCGALISETINAELGAAVDRSGGAPFDPRPLIGRIANRTLYRAIFGVRPSDPRAETLAAGAAVVGPHRPELQVDGIGPLIDVIRSLGRDLLAGSPATDDGSLFGTILREDSRCLDDATLLGNLALIVLVTRNNVRLTLAWVMKELLDHPAIMDDLRNHAGQELFSGNVVRETLRRHVSEFMHRETISDIPVGPYVVPSGWLIRVCVREAHDNASAFPEPHEFRPARFDADEFSPRHYCPGSDGSNSAIGAELAFMIATEFARALPRWTAQIVSDGAPERSGWRHWKHWEPSPRLRIKLTRR